MEAILKAKELVDNFSKQYPLFGTNFKEKTHYSKQCALICVEEQINFIKHWGNVEDYVNYLEEVKNQIQLL